MKPHPYRVGAPSRTIRADQERDRNRQSKPDVREDAAIRAYRRAPQAALDRWATDGGPAPSADSDSGRDSARK